MNDMAPISIDIVSDVVCPWCYIGQRRLDKALAAAPQVAAEIRWRPYQLDSTIPPEGMDRKQYMLAKFGGSERLGQQQANLVEAGAAEGIAFDFDAIEISPNTLDPHRLLRWAGTEGPDVQDRIARRMFRLFFEEGVNIAEHTVLIGTARECGMDAAVVETLLASDADVDSVKEEISTAGNMGITGVPCFLLENRYAVMGAQDPSVLADALTKVAEAKARGELEPAAG